MEEQENKKKASGLQVVMDDVMLLLFLGVTIYAIFYIIWGIMEIATVPNIPESVIEFIVKTYKNTIFFLDTVSTAKSVKIKDLLGYFHTIKPNKIEAEKLSGIKIKSDKDLHDVAEYFFKKGVKNVFITSL